ncbi:uncharacterized protein JCM15063_000680 [Sporobolomyces koalae]|uniref:uncharacterized protein n=1 Tax=Sporobolomyces koalae TaxID=500713 RepID=UPI003178ABCF
MDNDGIAPSRSPGYRGPINPNPGDGESAIVIYGYIPSLAFGIVALVLFGIALLGHGWRTVTRSRQTRVFHSLFVLGCVLELVGYSARLVSHYHPFRTSGFVVQYFFVVVAPIAFQAALYVALASAIRQLASKGNEQSLLGFDPKWMVRGMIIADVVTTLVQVAGAALIGTAESNLVRGKRSSISPGQANKILLAGLALQTAAFLIFITLLAIAVTRSHQSIERSRIPLRLSILLSTSAFLLLLRTTFRLSECASGIFSFASTNEGLFAGLEFTPVVLTCFVWIVFPLEACLPAPRDDMIVRDRPDPDEAKGIM